MFILFFAVWVLLNGKLNWEVAIFGAVISALLYLFCCRFMHYSPKRDLYNFKRLPKLFAFFLTVVGEIFRSAFALLPYVYSRREPDPVVARFKTERVRTETGRVLLANAITMTPGTITGSLKDGEYLVHCLDRSMAEGLDESVFVEKLERWEEG